MLNKKNKTNEFESGRILASFALKLFSNFLKKISFT